MSFTTKTELVSATYTCDKRGCSRSLSAGSELEPLGGNSHFGNPQLDLLEQTAQANGWSRWYGRSVFYYCPQHGPGARHSMERIW